MAFFGGVASHRPWPKLDLRDIIALTAALCFVSGIGYLAYMSDRPAPDNRPAVVVAPPPAAQAVVSNSDMVDALIPITTIAQGQKLLSSMFKHEQRHLAASEIGRVVRDFSEVDGSYAKMTITEDAPFLRTEVTLSPPANVITARIPSGYRAVAIPVDAESGVEGWARSGVKVDVVWITKINTRQVVSVIVENAQVLSAERSLDNNPDNNGADKNVPSHITLLVTAKEAQRIQLAKASGTLSLNLRGDDDQIATDNGMTTVERLLKARSGLSDDDSRARVTFQGKNFDLKSGSLVPADKSAEKKNDDND